MSHIPVLLQEVLEGIKASLGERFIDGTAGSGGYILKILEINKKAKVLGIDLDQASLEKLKQTLVQRNLAQRCELRKGSFANLKQIAEEAEIASVSGIILDLGFSSVQLEDPARGFSFQTEGPLDMRYDVSQQRTATEVVNKYSLSELIRVIKDYGEEKFSKKIAAAIVDGRKISPIAGTSTLGSIIVRAIPANVRHKAQDSVRRVFQAIRIEVNQELNNLRSALPQALDILEKNGRLAVISFHSLEDRIVKNFFREASRGCICPPDFPQCVCNKESLAREITRKPITASLEEMSVNPRSKPAKLRVLEKK